MAPFSCILRSLRLSAAAGGRGGAARRACSVLSNPSDRWRRRGSGRLGSRSRVSRTHSVRDRSREERSASHDRAVNRLTLAADKRDASPPHHLRRSERSRERKTLRRSRWALRVASTPYSRVHPRHSLSPVRSALIAVTCTHGHSCVAARRCSSPSPRVQFLRCIPRIRVTHPGDSAAEEVRIIPLVPYGRGCATGVS